MSIVILLVYTAMSILMATIFLPYIYSTLESTVYTIATRCQIYGLDCAEIDHQINPVFNSESSTESSRTTRQITYIEARGSIPIQTATSAYSNVFVTVNIETGWVDIYNHNEIEDLMASKLNQGPAINFKLYMIACCLFVTGGILANMEGVLTEKYKGLSADEYQRQVGLSTNCQHPPNLYNPTILPNATNLQNPTNHQNLPQLGQNVPQNIFQLNSADDIIDNSNQTNLQNPIDLQYQVDQAPTSCFKKLTHLMCRYGIFYHFGTILLALLALMLTISFVILLQVWARTNSVNTLRPASSANNLTMANPEYLFYLLIQLLPLVAYGITACSVPCGSVGFKPKMYLNNINNVNVQNNGQLMF